MTKSVLTILAAAALTASAQAAIFTQGNLVVVRATSTTSTLSAAAASAFLDEYTPAGTLVQSIALPTSTSGANRALSLRGNGDSEGALSRSADGRYLVLAGYDAAPGTASVGTSASATINRVVGRVNVNGIADTSTVFNNAFSANAIRSAATVDGSNYWVSGGTSGVQYIAHGATNGTQLSTTPTNNRFVSIYNNQLYVSSASGSNIGVNTVGSGLPTSGTNSVSLLPGISNTNGATSPYDYFFASPTTLYIADDSAGNLSANAGIQRWTLTAGTWTRQAVLANTSIFAGSALDGFRPRNLTGTTDALGNTILYVTGGTTSGSALIALTDNGTSTGAFNTIATSASGSIFRGVEFTPIPTPGALALLGLGGLVATRRRR